MGVRRFEQMRIRRLSICIPLFAVAVIAIASGWGYLRIKEVRRQVDLIAEIERVPGRVEFHENRYPAPAWMQASFVDRPIRSAKSVLFDFEDHPRPCRVSDSEAGRHFRSWSRWTVACLRASPQRNWIR